MCDHVLYIGQGEELIFTTHNYDSVFDSIICWPITYVAASTPSSSKCENVILLAM